jgi:hypothetical protein
VAVSSWNLGRSYKLHIRPVPRVCTMRVGIYMAHGWTRSKWAEQREAKGKKKKVVMKSSNFPQSQVGRVCTGEDERDLNLGVICRCFSSRSSVAWQGQVSRDPGFCFGGRGPGGGL